MSRPTKRIAEARKRAKAAVLVSKRFYREGWAVIADPTEEQIETELKRNNGE